MFGKARNRWALLLPDLQSMQRIWFPRTQSEICSIANVSEVTLRGLLRLIEGLMTKLGEASQQ